VALLPLSASATRLADNVGYVLHRDIAKPRIAAVFGEAAVVSVDRQRGLARDRRVHVAVGVEDLDHGVGIGERGTSATAATVVPVLAVIGKLVRLRVGEPR